MKYKIVFDDSTDRHSAHRKYVVVQDFPPGSQDQPATGRWQRHRTGGTGRRVMVVPSQILRYYTIRYEHSADGKRYGNTVPWYDLAKTITQIQDAGHIIDKVERVA